MAKAIVIGAGFGGIAAALRLRRKGYDVTIIDKQDKLGGRAYQYERHTPHGTFIHDAGPTVITAKFLFDELFELFGKKREDYVEFRDIYPWYRIVFAGDPPQRAATVRERPADSTSTTQSADSEASPNAPSRSRLVANEFPFFDYGGTLEAFEAQIAKFEPADVAGFRKYLEHSKKIFDVGFTQLGDQPFDKFTTMLKCAPALLRLQNYKTVYGMAKKYIRNENLRRVFSFQPLLVGGNPFNTTSIYSLIFYLERQWGVQFAMGGTGAIVRGLERLMREEGIEIRLGEEVSQITCMTSRRVGKTSVTVYARNLSGELKKIPVGSGRVSFAETTEGKEYSGHIIICNADTPYAYEKLIDPKFRKGLAARRLNRKSQIANLKFSMGLFVLYFGTTKQYPDVAHHTIVLGHAYKELITKLFDTLELETEDLSVYLHRPTATDPSMAPPGCESFYCLVPVPNLQSGHDWAEWGPKVRDATVKYLERTVLPGLSECIVDDFYVTPKHFEQNLNTLHGTGFSIAPIFSQSAWFRFHNKAPGIEGLYFVGAGTHPGAGMPGVLCSAKVIDRLIPSATP
ncbi:MAG: phytoene desaturase family protein [Tepidisphaeraceae bacterium]